MLEQHFITVGH